MHRKRRRDRNGQAHYQATSKNARQDYWQSIKPITYGKSINFQFS
jgi:hypothetical protein